MKQKLLNSIRLRVAMLVAVMCAVFTGQAWGDEVTLTQSALGLTGSYTSGTEKTIGGITFVYTDLMKNSDNIQAKASTGVIYNKTAFPGDITSVAITHSGTARSTTIYGSSDGTNWTQVQTGSGSITADFSASNYTYFKITRGSNAAYWTRIVITYTTAGGGSSCATPTFSPAAGAVDYNTPVRINCATDGATIYYTTDNTDPTNESSVYSSSSPIAITSATTIKAIAVKDGLDDSSVGSASYTISVATPECNLASSGNYLPGTELTLTSAGNTIYYNMTTDGSDPEAPTSISTEYAGPISLSSGTLKIKAIAYDTYGNASSVVSRTINGVNPTTLPFNWAGGVKATLTALDGVVGYGLGSDYAESHGAYRVKFDSDGDYIEVFTNAQPLKVSVGVKMIGGATSSSITVQKSTNGVEFTDVENLDISGSQNDVVELETTEDFDETTRVIKLVFNRGDNVGVGPIKITKYTVGPDIDIADSDVELAGDATYGEIEYSIINPDGVSSLTATSSTDWISNITVTATKVTFSTTANDGEEREGTITLSYEGATDKVITVTQAEKVVELTYNLVSSITSGKHYIITNGTSGTVKAMGAQRENNRGSVDVTVDAGNISFLSNAGVAELVIRGPYANGFYTIYDEKNEGYLYAASSSSNYLRTKAAIDDNCYWTIEINSSNGKATIKAQGSATNNWLRNNGSLFSCYASGQSDVYLYEKDGEAAPTESVTVGSAGYTTYTTQNPVSFPTGVTAYIATAVNSSTIHIEEILDAPAGTPIIIKAAENTYTLEKDYAELYIDVVKSTPNLLKSSDGKVTGDGVDSDADGIGEGTIYALGKKNGEVGFYLVKSGVSVPAGRAYLTIGGGSSVKDFLGFAFGDETKITETSESIHNSECIMLNEAGAVFDLSGRRVSKAQKGLYILNGRKVLVK